MSVPEVFADVPRTAREHFRLLYHGAVYRVLDHVRQRDAERGLDRAFSAYPFLRDHLEAMAPWLPDGLGWSETFAWWRSAVRRWEEVDAATPLPWRALREAEVLDDDGCDALLLAGLVEEDQRFGTLFAELQEPVPSRRPGTELLAAILRANGGEADAWALGRQLLGADVVTVADPRAPRSAWQLSVAPELWGVLRGDTPPVLPEGCRHVPVDRLARRRELVVPVAFDEQLVQVPAIVAAGQADAVVVRGMGGSDRGRIAEVLARDLGRGILLIEPQDRDVEVAHLGPICAALGALPVFRYELGPGETVTLPALPPAVRPTVVIVGREGGVRSASTDRVLTLNVPPTGLPERRRLWREALDGHAPAELDAISERFRLPPRHLRTAAARAVATAALERRTVVKSTDVASACRTLDRQHLDALASRVEPHGGWEQLVVNDLTRSRLDELARRCRNRERIADHLGSGFGARAGHGVRALLTGGSGTGKTLAATILAGELGMDVYRVDLAAIVNKYVGETEKNLHRVLSVAEELDVILLIDEGDALLGNRTEVRSANDRFANLETNYLLQRLETYEGIVVVTTNAGDRIDGAFQRRMDLVIPFAEPGPELRLDIWSLHLPEDHRIHPRFLEDIAGRCVLSGGQIRNAAMHATLLALEGDGIVRRAEVETAVRAEYAKAGGIPPFASDGHVPPINGSQAFLERLR